MALSTRTYLCKRSRLAWLAHKNWCASSSARSSSSSSDSRARSGGDQFAAAAAAAAASPLNKERRACVTWAGSDFVRRANTAHACSLAQRQRPRRPRQSFSHRGSQMQRANGRNYQQSVPRLIAAAADAAVATATRWLADCYNDIASLDRWGTARKSAQRRQRARGKIGIVRTLHASADKQAACAQTRTYTHTLSDSR